MSIPTICEAEFPTESTFMSKFLFFKLQSRYPAVCCMYLKFLIIYVGMVKVELCFFLFNSGTVVESERWAQPQT